MSNRTHTLHLLLVPIPAYGHIRPFCALACRAIANRNIVVLLLAPNWLGQARADIDSQLPGDSDATGRIRVVSLLDSADTDPFPLMALMVEFYPSAYNALFRGEAIRCATTGTTFAAMPPPTAVFLDMFCIEQLRETRAISGASVEIFTLLSGNAGALLRAWGPESMGGLGDFWANLDAEAARTGKTSLELGEERLKRTDGQVIKVPGKPLMFDHETCPQDVQSNGPPIPISPLSMILECDGIFLGTTRAYDGQSVDAFEEWITQTLRKPVYAVGPLLPPGYGVGFSLALPSKHAELQRFLDSMGSKYGKGFVLFISFGSVFWPTREEQLEELIDALIEKKFATVSDSLRHATGYNQKLRFGHHHKMVPPAADFKSSGNGLVPNPWWSWRDYRIACKWCSHVKPICWPLKADQPIAAEHLSQNLAVAFHLIEVRTGLKGLQPLHNGKVPRGTREALRTEIRDVIDQCRGPVGAEMRGNARRIQGEFAGAWADSGSSQVAMRHFITRYPRDP
ncbi:hypothetical protein C8R43DRAFT_1128196 [Mycena crocata]|nr:hypothetical protein C8R43DRAFT_1128196 [Mycena crocata]